jgi:hypothetical protein
MNCQRCGKPCAPPPDPTRGFACSDCGFVQRAAPCITPGGTSFGTPQLVRWACTHVRRGTGPSGLVLKQAATSILVRATAAGPSAANPWPDEWELCEACAKRILRELVRCAELKP